MSADPSEDVLRLWMGYSDHAGYSYRLPAGWRAMVRSLFRAGATLELWTEVADDAASAGRPSFARVARQVADRLAEQASEHPGAPVPSTLVDPDKAERWREAEREYQQVVQQRIETYRQQEAARQAATQARRAQALTVSCPLCGARRGRPCIRNGKSSTSAHAERNAKARP